MQKIEKILVRQELVSGRRISESLQVAVTPEERGV